MSQTLGSTPRGQREQGKGQGDKSEHTSRLQQSRCGPPSLKPGYLLPSLLSPARGEELDWHYVHPARLSPSPACPWHLLLEIKPCHATGECLLAALLGPWCAGRGREHAMDKAQGRRELRGMHGAKRCI